MQQVDAVAKLIAVADMPSQIRVTGSGSFTGVTGSKAVQGLRSGPFLREVKLPGGTGRTLQRTGQAVDHIQPLQHLDRKCGGRNNIESIEAAVRQHIPLHTTTLRTSHINTTAHLHLR